LELSEYREFSQYDNTINCYLFEHHLAGVGAAPQLQGIKAGMEARLRG
jgi:hypothetical protein